MEIVAGQKNIEKVVPDHPMFAALDSEAAAVIEMDDVRTPFSFQEPFEFLRAREYERQNPIRWNGTPSFRWPGC